MFVRICGRIEEYADFATLRKPGVIFFYRTEEVKGHDT